MSTVGIVSALIVLPFLTGLLLGKDTPPDRARLIAGAGLTLEMVLGAISCIWLMFHPGAEFSDVSATLPFLKARWHVELDGLSVLFVPLLTAVVLAIVLSAPRRETQPVMLRRMCFILGCTIGVYSAEDLLLFAMFWVAAFSPAILTLREDPDAEISGPVSRVFSFFAGLGSVSVVAATGLVAFARWQAPLPFDLDERTALPVHYGTPIFALLSIAILARKGVLPFHSWLPVLIERGPVGVAILFCVPHLGAFALLRVLVPLVPHTATEMLPLLTVLSLASALYLSVVALSQQDIKRTVGYVSSSAAALVLVGLCALDPEGLHGGILQTLSLSVGCTGLILTASWIKVRTGTVDLREMGGLVARFPKMAWVFLLLSLCTVGAPGTIGWVAEDMLLHALLVQHPAIATLFLLVSVMNSVTLLRVFFLAFLGPPRGEIGQNVTDLHMRESVVAFVVITAALLFGLAPQPLINLRSHAAQEILRTHYGESASVAAPRGLSPR